MTINSKVADTSTVDAVRQVFQDVLGESETVHVDSDFFELGGNSILAVQVVARLRRTLGIRVSLRDLFRARRAGALATLLSARID